MWQDALKQLFVDTIYTPRSAARQILGMKLPGNVIWMTLVLATALNSVAFAGTLLAFPPAAPPMVQAISPFLIAVLFFASMVSGAAALYWGGKTVGGVASFNDFLALVTWLQFMRFAVQVVGFVLMLFLPGLASIVTFVAMLYGIWIMLNFISEAQGFETFGKSVANLLMGFLGLVIALSFLISVIGLGLYEIS